ncbi:MAG: phenylalanine--tRNA ligase subunit beta [Coxiellaceae bacterium]|nr:phenylalanine--tRNA ligase subunit beta [Coxiellaceae bacterium]|tara:strand:+ start:13688 stop:16063 length:2376 start_codon:yes stop_codon:yes gene_type:complete
MRVSKQWLEDWVPLQATSESIATSLTMAGLEVDSVQSAASDFTGVVVGLIVACQPHPNADRLRCCRVDIGTEVVDIVCGGSNVRVDQKVPVATLGAQLGPDFTIKRSKLRGEPSCGMICSAKELGLGDDGSGGIMELASDAPVGHCIRSYLNLDDTIFDVDLTPNRGDCLSMKGIAREVAIFDGKNYQMPGITKASITSDASLSVSIKEEKACPRYVGRVIKNIAKGQTPLWMSERLRRSGLRLIHPLVDILNYVMIELGQPMHAFDLAMLNSSIVVRCAKDGETLQLLDEQTVELSTNDLVIADDVKLLALAGVMGGKASSVCDATTDVFLESAYFEPIRIAKTARSFGLQSDSSYRYARGVDVALQEEALERATGLILDICGGEVGPLTIRNALDHLPVRQPIRLRFPRIQRVLGVSIDHAQVEKYLLSLGMSIASKEDGWDVVSPSYRSDIHIEVDLIEEVARLFRFDKIPQNTQMIATQFPILSDDLLPMSQLKQFFTDLGYQETIHYSFIENAIAAHFVQDEELMVLANPLSNDMSTMRPSLWPAMLTTLRYNLNRQCQRQALFEVGCCFYQSQNKLVQQNRLALLLTGPRYPEQWGESQRPVDFYDLKGHVEAFLSNVSNHANWVWRAAQTSSLHPGQSVALYQGDNLVGWLGALHPSLAQELDIHVPVFLFEADMKYLQSVELPSAQAVSKFPSVRRDLSLIMDQQIVSSEVLRVIKQYGGPYLENVHIFDVYQGEECGVGKKSIALGLTFQAASRTLVDDDINQVIDIIMKALKNTLNATLRV